MSQILQTGGGTPPPGTFVETLTGNTGGPVGPTAGNINVIGDGFVEVDGDPGTSTLTISIDNEDTADAQTVGLVTVPIFTVPVADSEMVTITAVINGLEDDFTNAYGCNFTFTVFRPAGGNVTIVGAPIINANTTSTADTSGTVDVGAQEAVVNVVGVAGETWNWRTTYQLYYL